MFLMSCDADAVTVRVLAGRALECVRILIPNANVVDGGFHDVTLLDMADALGPTVPVGDLCLLQRQWPVLVLSDMSRNQMEL